MYYEREIGDDLTEEDRLLKCHDLLTLALLKGDAGSLLFKEDIEKMLRINQQALQFIEEQRQSPNQEPETTSDSLIKEEVNELIDILPLSNQVQETVPPPLKKKKRDLKAITRKKKEIKKKLAASFKPKLFNVVKNDFIPIRYVSAKIEKEFQALWEDDTKRGRKIHEIIEDILCYKWELKGVGKPEILKHSKGETLWSRRLDHENRIVYCFKENHLWLYSCSTHYENISF
jgi:toxin YoeB